MAEPLTFRPMRAADVPAVLSVQARCYAPEFVENARAFEAKLAAVEALRCCWVAEQGGALQAYLVSLPVCEASFPAWNAQAFAPSPRPTLLYLHDLAVSPGARGLGTALVERVKQAAQDLALPDIGLIAVQDSLRFWQRQGFSEAAETPPHIASKLLSFGAQARYLSQQLAA